MSDADSGGPAFPRTVQRWNDSLDHVEGMSLRDWFAGQVAAEMIRLTQLHDGGWDTVAVAAGCYDMADAMLAVRKGGAS